MPSLASALVACVEITYGCVILTAALVYSCFQKEFWYARTEEEESALQEASRDLWDLAHKDDAIAHNFLTTRSGTQIHFLTPRVTTQDPDTLIVFLHGFPDSAYLFSHQIHSAWSTKAQLVALDLPGCGGSDSLQSYSAEKVLNVIVEAIDQLKARFSHSNQSKPRCILVGHDWGGVIGFRLAAETTGLLDELVTINSIYPRYAAEVLKANVSRGGALISKGKLREAASELRPVRSQILKSGYTYMLNLPVPLARISPGLSRCLVKLSHSLEYKQSPESSPKALARRLAIAYGPSSSQCAHDSIPKYGTSVLARSQTHPPGDWDQRVRLYSDGLLRDSWTPSFLASPKPALNDVKATKTQAPQGPAVEDDNDDWHFHCPVSIIFGLQDIALDPSVVLDGIERHFMSESTDSLVSSAIAQERITRLSGCGHWSILEDEGIKALDRFLARIID